MPGATHQQSLRKFNINNFKAIMKLPNLHVLMKLKTPSLPRNLTQDFWRIANSVLNKGKSAIPPIFNGLEVLSSASDKAKLFAKIFLKNSNLGDSGISLPAFPSRTNLKLHNISVTPKMVKKIIKSLDSSKASGPDYIPVVVVKNCEPEISYLLAELLNMCLRECCFLDCWKVLSVVPQLKAIALLVFFLWLVKFLQNW